MTTTLSQSPSAATTTTNTATPARAWMYSPAIDIGVLVVPMLLAIGTYAMMHARGTSGMGERAYATLIAQFVLGNTTHVVLTFLAVGVRRDLLSPVPGQKNTLIYGSLTVFLVTSAMFWLTLVTYPKWFDFAWTVSFIFAQHHRLSQVKGIWALYSLRGKQAPTPLERKFQNSFVAVSLLFVVARLLLFPHSPRVHFALLVPVPGVFAPLPYSGVFVLLALYLPFAAGGVYALLRAKVALPKLLYVSTHFAVVALTLYAPLWGFVVTAGIHGLEYFLLTGRMLKTRAGDSFKLGTGGAVLAMLLAMSPMILIGFASGPYMSSAFVTSRPMVVAHVFLNGIVMAHYFADAFLYRLRLPAVRKVVLGRLGML